MTVLHLINKEQFLQYNVINLLLVKTVNGRKIGWHICLANAVLTFKVQTVAPTSSTSCLSAQRNSEFAALHCLEKRVGLQNMIVFYLYHFNAFACNLNKYIRKKDVLQHW